MTERRDGSGTLPSVIRPGRHDDLLVIQNIESAAGSVFGEIGMTLVAEDDVPSIDLMHRMFAWAIDHSLPAVTLTTFVEVPVEASWNGTCYQRNGFRFLSADELTSGSRVVREAEQRRGLDRWPRACMRREF